MPIYLLSSQAAMRCGLLEQTNGPIVLHADASWEEFTAFAQFEPIAQTFSVNIVSDFRLSALVGGKALAYSCPHF